MATQSAPFKKAVDDSKKLESKPSDTELLELYGLYKQGLQDPTFESTSAPGMFDLKGKAKYRAWEKLVKDGVTPEQAQDKYVNLVEELKAKLGYDANKVPETVGS